MGRPAARPLTSRPATESASTMVAVAQDHYGGPDVLQVVRTARPVPRDGEALVRTRAASVNARDWHVMRGEPRLARLLDRDTFALRRPRAATRGTDLAGVVEAVGPGVTRWRVGDAVFGEGTGSFADFALARADQLAAIPDGVTFEQAAALPLAATTALMCVEAVRPAPGRHVLVNGASGGVGTLVVQMARSRGARVTAVVSSRNVAQTERLGADRVIDYTLDDFTSGPDRYDAVIDLVGNRRLRDLRRAVRPGGALVLSGGGVPGRGRIVGPLGLLMRAALAGRFLGVAVRLPQARPDSVTLTRVADLVATREIAPVVDRTFPLVEAPAALHYVETEHARAKVLITTTAAPEVP